VAIPRTTHLNDLEQLDVLVLDALAEPIGRGDRAPAAIARQVHRAAIDVTEACRRLEGAHRLERWMGLRPTREGFSYLAELHRRQS
jgi:hypothetical protein